MKFILDNLGVYFRDTLGMSKTQKPKIPTESIKFGRLISVFMSNYLFL